MNLYLQVSQNKVRQTMQAFFFIDFLTAHGSLGFSYLKHADPAIFLGDIKGLCRPQY